MSDEGESHKPWPSQAEAAEQMRQLAEQNRQLMERLAVYEGVSPDEVPQAIEADQADEGEEELPADGPLPAGEVGPPFGQLDDYGDARPAPDPDPDPSGQALPAFGQAPAEAPPAAPETLDPIAMLVRQNQEMMDRLAQLTLQNNQLQAGQQANVQPGFVYPDGQVHYARPKMSEDEKWDRMEDEGGLLG